MIRIEAVWLAIDPLDMRSGTEAALARVVHVFGSAHPHHAYLFANRRANRMKVLVHDGIGVWLAARRLNQGKFVWPRDATGTLALSGQLQPHSPENLVRKSAGTSYDPQAKCPKWEKFLLEIMCGDDELVRYLQRALGYKHPSRHRRPTRCRSLGEGKGGAKVADPKAGNRPV